MATLAITHALNGKGLGRALSKLKPELSFGALQSFARKGRILLNGKRAHLGVKVRTGDQVEIPELGVAANPKVEFGVLHEAPELLVVDKPAGVAVLPGPGNWRGALACGLLARYPELRSLDDCGLGHRIDRDTSGALAVARNAASLEALRKAFRQRQVHKCYLALCLGNAPQTGRVDRPLAERRQGDHLRAVVARRGKPARTHFSLRARAHGYSLLAVRTETGRFHQIRAHLQTLGFPLAGDPLYGDAGENQRLAGRHGLQRLFLHASELGLPAQLGGWQGRAPLPPELETVLQSLGIAEDPR